MWLDKIARACTVNKQTYYVTNETSRHQSTKVQPLSGYLTQPHPLSQAPYYSLFHSHLTYSSQIWGQGNGSVINKIMQLQSKAIRIISFLPKNSPTEAKKTELNILSLKEQIILQNILFIKSYLNKPSSNSFSTFLTRSNTIHNHTTRSNDTYQLNKPAFKTEEFGRNSIINRSINDWNRFQTILKADFNKLSYGKLKNIVTNHFHYKNN